jgi:hypothetical protein
MTKQTTKRNINSDQPTQLALLKPVIRNLSPGALEKERMCEVLRGFVVFSACRVATIRINHDKHSADYLSFNFDQEKAMTAVEALQQQMAALQQKLVEETLAEAVKQREMVLQKAKAREAEVARGLKEIAGLMRQYRLNKEHLFKAAQQSGVVNGSPVGFEHGAKDSQLRADVTFDVSRNPASSAPAKPKTLEEMRQFYGNMDAQLNDFPPSGASLN